MSMRAKSAFAVKSGIRRAVEAEGIPHTLVANFFFSGYFLPNLAQPGSQSPPTDKVVILSDGTAKGKLLLNCHPSLKTRTVKPAIQILSSPIAVFFCSGRRQSQPSPPLCANSGSGRKSSERQIFVRGSGDGSPRPLISIPSVKRGLKLGDVFASRRNTGVGLAGTAGRSIGLHWVQLSFGFRAAIGSIRIPIGTIWVIWICWTKLYLLDFCWMILDGFRPIGPAARGLQRGILAVGSRLAGSGFWVGVRTVLAGETGLRIESLVQNL
ncbi:unnamed protein product [Cuscuta campestris]|uniref:NmrA-like domain-containing protein n=1 Tax=Cuscuta campestris TaxID=132261 RepID=A0A484L9K5_9ASTE|nr:unnamed protein product [Cuscuta campestris]